MLLFVFGVDDPPAGSVSKRLLLDRSHGVSAAAMRHAEVLTPYLDRSLLETIYRSVGQSLGKKPGVGGRVFVGRNGSLFVKKTRVYKRCFNLMVVDMEKFGGVKWFDLCFDFTMKIGKCLGSMRFSGGFFSKPSTKIPPSRKRDFSWNRILQSLAGIYQGVKLICMYIHIYCIYIQYIYIYICMSLFIYIYPILIYIYIYLEPKRPLLWLEF